MSREITIRFTEDELKALRIAIVQHGLKKTAIKKMSAAKERRLPLLQQAYEKIIDASPATGN